MRNLPKEILEAVKLDCVNNGGVNLQHAQIEYSELSCVYVKGHDKRNMKLGGGLDLVFCFDSSTITYEGESPEKYDLEITIKCGYKTPKGYFSTKMIPVEVVDVYNLTDEEVLKMWEFKTDAKKNSFDPFYHENEAKRRNASAWNYITANYITDPYCTR